MSSAVLAEKSDTSFPLVLVVDREGVGGLAGIVPLPTVSLRDAATTTSYYDWADNTFKTSGWTLRDGPMVDIGNGVYQRSLDVLAFPLLPGAQFTAEFRVSSGPDIKGEDADLVTITEVQADTSVVRKYHTNRIWEASGNPGTLTLYDDDDSTIIKTHNLNDETGGAIAASVATPARRTKSP